MLAMVLYGKTGYGKLTSTYIFKMLAMVLYGETGYGKLTFTYIVKMLAMVLFMVYIVMGN